MSQLMPVRPILTSGVVKEMTNPMSNSLTQAIHRLFAAIACLVATGLLAGPAPAGAAPTLEVGLSDAANQVQAITVFATGGQFRLHYGSGGPGASETGDIPAIATASEVESALNSLTNISSGGGSVSVDRTGAAN